MTIEFKEHASYKSEENDTVSVFIDGQKTNLWYRLPSYKLYGRFTDEAESKATTEFMVELIKSGKIVKKDWTNFDHCAYLSDADDFEFESVEELSEIPKGYSLYSVSSVYDMHKEKIMKETMSKIKTDMFVQYCKIIDFKKKRLKNKIGIWFSQYGYSVYAI